MIESDKGRDIQHIKTKSFIGILRITLGVVNILRGVQ